LKEEALARTLSRNHRLCGDGDGSDDDDDEDDAMSQGHRSLTLCYKTDVSSLRIRLSNKDAGY
jgi:hypothetical protein